MTKLFRPISVLLSEDDTKTKQWARSPMSECCLFVSGYIGEKSVSEKNGSITKTKRNFKLNRRFLKKELNEERN